MIRPPCKRVDERRHRGLLDTRLGYRHSRWPADPAVGDLTDILNIVVPCNVRLLESTWLLFRDCIRSSDITGRDAPLTFTQYLADAVEARLILDMRWGTPETRYMHWAEIVTGENDYSYMETLDVLSKDPVATFFDRLMKQSELVCDAIDRCLEHYFHEKEWWNHGEIAYKNHFADGVLLRYVPDEESQF
jgi:hypothetical protein